MPAPLNPAGDPLVKRTLVLVSALLLSVPIAFAMITAPGAAEACSRAAGAAGWTAPSVQTAAGETLTMDTLINNLAGKRVVFVGELHDRFDHHLNQLEIACGLASRGPLAIGLEFVQAPFQPALDAYVFEHGDLQRMLAETEWFSRWRYDPRLYEPIFEYARVNRIPLVALNVPGELVSQVAVEGMASLDDTDRAKLPASIDDGPARYRERVREVFEQHSHHGQSPFEHFLQAQLLWDEGMAQRAADYLLEHPQRRLLVLAGEGHIAWGDPIPDRLTRRVDVPRALVIQSHGHSPGNGAADFVLDTAEQELPKPGRLGVMIGETEQGVTITGFGEVSAGRDAGLEKGDRIVALDHRPVEAYTDVRLALWRKVPGDPVTVAVRRGDEEHQLAFEMR